MTEITYRVIPKGKGGFDVEMEKPDGRRRTVPGFHSEHEAEAWIIQAKRLIRDAGPWTPLAPRKPTPATAATVPVKPTEEAEQPAPEPPRRSATARGKTKPVSERCDA